MNPDIFGDAVLVRVGGFPVTGTMATTAVVSLLLVAAAAGMGRSVRRSPGSRTASVGRLVTSFVSDLVEQAAGARIAWMETFAGTLLLFILGCAVIGQLPGVRAPTASLATTGALAIVVFLAVPAAGIRARGFGGYFREYLRPNPLLLPLHVISELSRTIALALRLFGNMLSGHLVVGLIVALIGLFVPIPLMALDLLIGGLQAYIFTILACVYLGAAVRAEGAS